MEFKGALLIAVAVFGLSTAASGVWLISGWQGGHTQDAPWYAWPLALTASWLLFSYARGWI